LKYDLENLIITFEKHSKDMQKIIHENAHNIPNSDHNPDWDFCLSKALLHICLEIQKLSVTIDRYYEGNQ
jgi:hypothetical protein